MRTELPDFDKVFALCKPFLEEAGRLTDKAEKLVELYKPQMTAAEEIVPLTDLFFEDFPELTDAEKEVMAGETVPTVLEADRKSTRLNSSHLKLSRMPSSA